MTGQLFIREQDMKKIIVILLLIATCVPTFGVTRKKTTQNKKTTKVWNVIDCEYSAGVFMYKSKPQNNVTKSVSLDVDGNCVFANSKAVYKDGLVNVYKTSDSSIKQMIEIIIGSDTLSIMEYDPNINFDVEKYITIRSNNCKLSIIKKKNDSRFVSNNFYFVNGAQRNIDINNENNNPKYIWECYQLLYNKFLLLYKYNEEDELKHKTERDFETYISIAQDDFKNNIINRYRKSY